MSMLDNRFRLGLRYFLILLGILLLAILARAKGPSSAVSVTAQAQRSGALYVELIETNHDTFQEPLFMESAPSQSPPFDQREGRIWVNPRQAKSIQGAKLFLVHRIRYDGVGRRGYFADHHIFSRLPAKISLSSAADEIQGKVHLTLDDSIAKTLQIRGVPGGILTISEASGGGIEVSFAGRTTKVSADKEQLLTGESKDLAVTQELLSLIPKGEVAEKDVRVETLNFGTTRFSTELRIKNGGSCEVQIETL